jgi:DNA recombination protein RmuC
MNINEFLFILGIILVAGIAALLFKKSGTDKAQSEAIRDLERRLTDVMINQLKEIRGSVDGTSKAMNQQISSFTRETVQIREELKGVQETMKSISSFQEIFRTPKLRGEWGEANLGHILSEYFPKELCLQNYLFSSGAQVEFVLKLPNKKLLPIDAKFFSDNFVKMKETQSEEERSICQKKLIQDIKFNINEISSKYILPPENTVDFALMFVPAEAIFYEIMFNLRDEDIASYARSKKVVLSSPNTIYLTLRTIIDWFRDTQISHQTQEILKRLNRIQADATKLMDGFRKLGGHIKNASSAYEDSERRLSMLDERVEKLVEIGETKKLEEPKEK